MKTVITLMFVMFLAGCATPPRIEVHGQLDGVPFSYLSEKDMSVEAERKADGTMRLKIQSDASAVMQAQTQLMQTYLDRMDEIRALVDALADKLK